MPRLAEGSTPNEQVRIHYTRPHGRVTIFEQLRVHAASEGIVTFTERCGVERTVRVGDDVILEPESPIVWFTFARAWHDIGRFHRADGTFTGIYANIITPVHFLDELTWETTDLFLDVWVPANSEKAVVLDREEFQAALFAGAIDGPTAAEAEAEVARILAMQWAGRWPPALVNEWTLERARASVRG
jgi:predicted RNA-binding protein associated with RNAse of E/G family